MSVLVWFKSDLRLDDNPVLLEALGSDACLPVYCLDPGEFVSDPYGISACGARRAAYLLESLTDLHVSLQQRGSGLLVKIGGAERVIPQLCAQLGIDQIVSHDEHAPDEQALLRRISAALPEGTRVTWRPSNALFALADLPFSEEKMPQVFTRFRHQVEKYPPPIEALAAPEQLPGWPDGASDLVAGVPCITDLGFSPVAQEPRSSLPYPGGETAAKQWLDDYLWRTQAIRHYKSTRNQLHGRYFSSKLSAALAHGCLSPRSVLLALRRHEARFGANESTYWLWFELLWREFFRLNLRLHGKHFFLRGGLHAGNPPAGHDQRFRDWRNAETGQPFIDACMTELNASGFLSNRARQIVASYLVHDLQQDWRLGAAWFQQQLVDYDVASNWGNWAYIAGVGHDPRGGRVFNLAKQVEQYDPEGRYVEIWSR
ncbi:DASH family cryptochrome [Pseudomonas sp. NyZ704]|nr:DASH family cryptochrome [Pseudomonas sp. NyZ704]